MPSLAFVSTFSRTTPLLADANFSEGISFCAVICPAPRKTKFQLDYIYEISLPDKIMTVPQPIVMQITHH